MLVKTFQTISEIYKAYQERKNLRKIHFNIQSTDRLTSQVSQPIFDNTNPTAEIAFKPTPVKPWGLTEESFTTSKGPFIVKSQSEIEITHFFIDNKQDIPQVSQTQQESFLNKSTSHILKNSAFYQTTTENNEEKDDVSVQNLKEILERNQVTRKTMAFQARLNQASRRLKNIYTEGNMFKIQDNNVNK